MSRVGSFVIVVVPGMVAGAVVAGAAAVAGVPVLLVVAAGLAVAAGVAVWLWCRSTGAALRVLGASPDGGRGVPPRLANVVENLCAVHGLAEPELHVTEPDGPNAAVAGRRSGSHLVVTRGLLETLDRLELEAVVARELCQIRRGVRGATVLAGVAGLLGSGPAAGWVVSRLFDPRHVIDDDLEAIKLTRYPPALSSALTKVAEGGRGGGSSGLAPAGRHLWVVEPPVRPGTATVQPPVPLRVAALEEI